MIFLFLFEIVLFFIIRFLPIWRFRHQGCDAYYFLLTAEIFRKKRRIPIVLPPYYLADIEEQWYPPGFSVFLGLLPEKFLKEYHWLINHVLDFANFLVMDAFMLWRLHVGQQAVLLANLVYIFTPTLTLEYRVLTSRSLGNLLFTSFMLALWSTMRDIRWLPVTLFTWLLILFTHKMTMQLGLVMGIVLSTVFKTWLPVIVVFGGIPLAIFLSKGYYWKILKGHWDIVTFWHKNLPWLGAHQVYDSPLYGSEQKAVSRSSNSGLHKLLVRVVLHNPFLPLIVLFVIFSGFFKIHWLYDRTQTRFFLCWSIVVLIWALSTTSVPGLKSLGEGYKYAKYSAFPVALLSPICPIWIIIVGSLISTLVLGKGIAKTLHKKRFASGVVDTNLTNLIEYLKKHEEIDYLGVLSTHFADAIVYFAHKRVLWGTHHYFFNKKIRDFFPILRLPVSELSKKYNLKYWCLNSDYVKIEDLGFSTHDVVYKSGPYLIVQAKIFGKGSVRA